MSCVLSDETGQTPSVSLTASMLTTDLFSAIYDYMRFVVNAKALVLLKYIEPFVDDLILEAGVVSRRVATTLRTAETYPVYSRDLVCI